MFYVALLVKQIEYIRTKKNISEITGICLITKRNGQKINKIKISIKSNFSFATKLVYV